jgi:hypothetical protein
MWNAWHDAPNALFAERKATPTMKTCADRIHPQCYQDIREAVQALVQNNLPKAKACVDSLIAGLPEPPLNRPEDIQTLFFTNAIHKRLNPQADEIGNLYLTPDQGQQIKMFNFMAEKFPLVRLSQDIINTAYAEEIKTATDVVILDIGIGSGQQIVRLLRQLAAMRALPQQLMVIGIEPAPHSLASAKAALENEAAQNHLAFRFVEIPQAVETMTAQDWLYLEDILRDTPGKRIVNASFALHHIRPIRLRDTLFARLKAFNPAIFGIIEPYADFLTPNLTERFNNAWQHYGLTFRAIDQIDASVDEKNAVKKLFFSREIQDVLAEDEQRTEQFETGEMWAARQQNAAFEPYPLDAASLQNPHCSFVTIRQNSAYIGLNIDDFPIVSIVAGR